MTDDRPRPLIFSRVSGDYRCPECDATLVATGEQTTDIAAHHRCGVPRAARRLRGEGDGA